MKPDLKSMTRKELEGLKTRIEKALARLQKQDMKAALAAAKKAAKAHGFTLAEVTGAPPPAKRGPKPGKKPKQPGVPKYADPDDKTKTWTGKGRRPDWFVAAMEAGKSSDDLAI